MAKCHACNRYETEKTITPEQWLKYGVKDITQTTPALCCQNCQMDVLMSGQWNGIGYAWLQAELEKRRGTDEPQS